MRLPKTNERTRTDARLAQRVKVSFIHFFCIWTMITKISLLSLSPSPSSLADDIYDYGIFSHFHRVVAMVALHA